MLIVKDKLGSEIFIGSLVAVSTNSGMYVGRVTKFNIWEHTDGTKKIGTVQVLKTDGKKLSYDGPEWRMINLDQVHVAVERFGL